MSWFPWVKQPVEFQGCKHCGKPQPVEVGRVVVCSCSKSLEEQQLERQRQQNWIRGLKEAKNGS